MRVSRRSVMRGAAATAAALVTARRGWAQVGEVAQAPLREFGYDQVAVRGALQTAQRANVTTVLMAIDPDSLVKPFREMNGQAAPGANLGGWYEWKPDYDYHHDDAGFAPAHCYGQWMSGLARLSACAKAGGAAGDPAMEARVLQMDELLAETISPAYFEKTRFPCYSFDKLLCGLMDAQQLVGDGRAFQTLETVLAAAEPRMPGRSINRDIQWKMGADPSWMWDESYTMPENLFLVSKRMPGTSAGERYRAMARAYLTDRTLFEPLSRNLNALSDQHAYSYTNALCSAMQAYLTDGSAMHFDAARNGFAMIEAQSFATGGWGPDEQLRKPGYNDVADSLTNTHNSFETPCGSYAHMKLTRYLLRATRDGHYGDSMERVLWNTVLGSLPLQSDGKSFYYADYNVAAKRIYSVHRWPCCAGTLPQVAADYGINGYLQEPGAVWVNLYQASELRWSEGGSAVQLEQTGAYPDDGLVRLDVSVSQPVRFAMQLRIPRWAGEGATLRVNGRAAPVVVRRGFAAVERTWRTGDTVELNLPMQLRIEAMPSNGGMMQLSTLALLYGPRVLFALRAPTDSGPLEVDSKALLNAERTGPRAWRVRLPNGTTREMVPWTEIGLREYSTYVKAV